MKATEILVLGIGQAGNNIAEELKKQNKRLTAVCINSSEADMLELSHVREKVVLPATGGANRDRDIAKQYLKDEIFLITDVIAKYAMKKYIYIAFSLGGGTGSGITPTLLQILRKTMPDRMFNLIGVLPKNSDGKKAHENAIECWQDLMAVKDVNIGAFYLLDNNKRPYNQTINREFANLFNKFLDITTAHVNGVIDAKEMTELGNTPGLSAIYDIEKYLDAPSQLIDNCAKDSIFVLGSKHKHHIGITAPVNFDKTIITENVGQTGEIYEGYTEDNPLLVLSGVNMTNTALGNVYDVYRYKVELEEINRKALEEEKEEDIELELFKPKTTKKPKASSTSTESKSIDELLEDEDDFWDDILNM